MPRGCRMGVCKDTKEDCVGWKKSDSVQCGPCCLLAEIAGVGYLPKQIQTVPRAELVGDVPDRDRCELTVQQCHQSGGLCLAAPQPSFTQQYKSCNLGKAQVFASVTI